MKIGQHWLTPRQVQVWKFIAEGVPSKNIAVEMGCTESTVDSHRSNLYAKIGCACAADATRAAVRYGIIQVPIERS